MPQNKVRCDQNKGVEREGNIQGDMLKIEKARQEFVKKNFKTTIEIYSSVEHKNLLNDLDNNLILFAEQQIRKEEK